jgi:type III secretion protein R
MMPSLEMLNQPLPMIAALAVLSLLPLLAVSATSFLKLSIVFALLRNAIGVQQVPPNMAMQALALILTCFIMAPVGFEIRENIESAPEPAKAFASMESVELRVLAPYRAFLSRHTKPRDIQAFADMGRRSWPPRYRDWLEPESLVVLIPAFMLGQIKEAFSIGVLLFLPFLAIDLIVSNILLALGMMMMSPMTISLPFKLLIFVMIDGWGKLIRQLVLSYA